MQDDLEIVVENNPQVREKGYGNSNDSTFPHLKDLRRYLRDQQKM